MAELADALVLGDVYKRQVFTSKTGPGIATSLIDLGDRFRLIINDVECKKRCV